ncbi:hypothetical protein JCM10213v2_003364 [Rhodosporidiobolus nylandii]
MLDQLPLELLQHTITYAVPPTDDFLRHEERLLTLSRLSLVSRRLHAAAIPLLGQIVFPNAGDVEDWSWNGIPDAIWEHGRVLLIEASEEFDGETFAEMVELLPHAQDLRVDAQGGRGLGFRLEMLDDMEELRRLQIASAHVEVGDILHFSHLTELSLHFVVLGQDDFDSLVSTESLPALRALNMGEPRRMPYPGETSDLRFGMVLRAPRRYFPILPTDLLPRLEILQVEAFDIPFFPSTLFTSATPILLDVCLDAMDESLSEFFTLLSAENSHPSPQHVRAWCCLDRPNSAWLYDTLFSIISSDRPPRTLYIPASHARRDARPPSLGRGSWSWGPGTPQVEEEADLFFALCDKKGVRVRHEDRAPERGVELHVCQDFHL